MNKKTSKADIEAAVSKLEAPFKTGEIVLKLPIKIQRTCNDDGYIITDAEDVEHFFYEQGLAYDGNCRPVTKTQKTKPKSAKKKK